jgi:hypothetical protein
MRGVAVGAPTTGERIHRRDHAVDQAQDRFRKDAPVMVG